MEVPLGLAPFARQSRLEHALVVVAGAVAFAAGYLGGAALVFGTDALAHGGDRTPLRVAGAAGSIACWGVYGLAFVRGKGGPVLNATAYPLATATLAPTALRWTLFGPNPAALRERFGFFLFNPGLFVDAAALVVPGISAFVTVLSVWGATLDEAEIEAWQRRHLRPAFYAAFVEEE